MYGHLHKPPETKQGNDDHHQDFQSIVIQYANESSLQSVFIMMQLNREEFQVDPIDICLIKRKKTKGNLIGLIINI